VKCPTQLLFKHFRVGDVDLPRDPDEERWPLMFDSNVERLALAKPKRGRHAILPPVLLTALPPARRKEEKEGRLRATSAYAPTLTRTAARGLNLAWPGGGCQIRSSAFRRPPRGGGARHALVSVLLPQPGGFEGSTTETTKAPRLGPVSVPLPTIGVVKARQRGVLRFEPGDVAASPVELPLMPATQCCPWTHEIPLSTTIRPISDPTLRRSGKSSHSSASRRSPDRGDSVAPPGTFSSSYRSRTAKGRLPPPLQGDACRAGALPTELSARGARV
jgi:hypothetical protein